MGLLETGLAISAALVVTACYSPDLRDCTLSCSSASDCAADQVCGSDHFCAAPEIAGRCSSLPPDAGSGNRDAGIRDARLPDARPDAPPDAPTEAVLSIEIAGKGQISMLGVGTCDSEGPQHGSCTFVVSRGALVTAQASASSDWRFEKWTSAPCATSPIALCTFIAGGPLTIGVKFKKEHD